MFQFPRCPLGDRSPSARPCAGRVAPFGHPRIAGCQRLPGAFRRVAASFLGRQRQGIHHAPIMRISCLRLPSGMRVTTPADRHAPAGWSRLAAPAAPSTRRPLGTLSVCVCVFVYVAVQCARASRHEPLPPHQNRCDGRLGSRQTPSRADHRPAAAEPDGFRVAPCQSARPEGRLTRRSSDPKVGVRSSNLSRSSNLVRSRLPTSDELSQPRRGLLTAAGMTKGVSADPARVEPRGFEPRTSAVQGRRSPS
jgi:hypothetical protein